MSVIKFISNIKSKLFEKNEEPSFIKISSILDEYEPDLEAGEGYYYKKLITALQFTDALELIDDLEVRDTLKFVSNTQLYDLEMGDKSIIYEEVVFEECNIINYLSFNTLGNIINYFVRSNKI